MSILSLKDKISSLPTEPGCYLMKNSKDTVIYVGKAKNLRNRVRSYFVGAHNQKTTKLVSEIQDFSYVLTNSEQESLILELNLIKQYTPKYNIKLMDDKTYPYLKIEEGERPKLVVVRQKEATGKLFGPYPNSYSARETARLLNRLYPLRACEEVSIHDHLFFHVDKYLEPCYNGALVNYDEQVQKMTRFLKGDIKEVIDLLTKEMHQASQAYLFEQAAEYRDMINHIEQTTEKQIVSLNDYKDRDAIGFAYNKDDVAIQILMMRRGKIVDYHQVVFQYVGEVSETVLSYLQQHYEFQKPDEFLFSNQFEEADLRFLFGKKILIPQKGDKKKLVDLALKNAAFDLEHHSHLYRSKLEKEQAVQDELHQIFKREINHIEVFDNAQLFGTAPISALIVYQDGKFNRKGYRKYHLQTTTNDDYQAMREVIYRRYYKVLIENLTRPDLILVDGGKGQLSAAKEVLDSLNLDIPLAGLKKNQKHQLDSLVYQTEVITLSKQSYLYKFLGKLSEEVHRFAIDFHRSTRKKNYQKSFLDDIKGLGAKRKKLLLSHFKSIDAIKEASNEELKTLGIPSAVILTLKEVLK